MTTESRIRDLQSRAQGLNSAGRYARAETVIARALELLADAPPPGVTAPELARLEGRLLITRAVCRLGLEGRDAALDQLEEVRRIARTHELPLLTLQSHVQEGAIRAAQDDWHGTLHALEHLTGRLDELSPRERCSALLNRGLAAVSLHDLGRGRDDLEAARRIAVDEGLAAQRFKAEHNLGCVAWFAGDIPGALRLMARAADIDVDVGRARALVDQGKVLLDAGLLDEAEGVLERALDTARRDRHALELGDVHLDLARAALLRDHPTRARRHAVLARRAFRRVQAHTRAEDVALFIAALDVTHGRRLGPALARALPHVVDRPRTSTERLAQRIVVDVSLTTGDLPRAAQGLRRLRAAPPPSLSVLLHERLLAARLALARRHPAAARTILRRAADDLAGGQGAVHSLEIRAALAVHARRLRDVDVHLASETQDPHDLFDSVERWRAVSHRTASLWAPDDPQARRWLGRLRQLHREGRDDPELVRTLEARIAARLRSLPSDADTSPVPPPADADLVARLLARRGGALVGYHPEGEHLVRLVNTPDGITMRRIGLLADLEPLVAMTAADLAAAARSGPALAAAIARASADSLARLDRLLIGGDLPDGPLVIVPTTALLTVGWRALPSLRHRPVIVTPSATLWAAGEYAAPGPVRVAALAGPGVPRARSEVESVVQAWRSRAEDTRCLPRAVTDEVRSTLEEATIVHLAAHGRHVEQNPLFSSIHLHDGPVVAHDLPRPVRAGQVVLSACDVGRSRGRPGDEPLGLAAALLALGVRTVVASTSPVRDEVAEVAMTTYHGGLAAGLDAATALARATADLPGGEAFSVYGTNWVLPAPAVVR